MLREVATASKRVRRVLHLVDELDLNRAELCALREELDLRQGCEIDIDACKPPEEREFASEIKRRMDDSTQGSVEIVPVTELLKRGREELRRLEANRQPSRRRPAAR